MKKYYLPKSKSIEKSIVKEKSSNIMDPSTPCSSTFELVMLSIESESSNSQPSQVIDHIPDANTIPEPIIITKLIGLAPSTSQKISIQVENDDPHSEIDISVESDAITDPKNITCIFCDQKT